MKTLGETELVGLVLGWIAENSRNTTESNNGIGKGTDLLSTGILDSLDFVNLLVFIEEEVGCKIDLADIKPEDFSTVEGLCRCALSSE